GIGAGAIVGGARLLGVTPKIGGRRSLAARLAQLNLVGVAIGVGDDHGDGLPVPLRGGRAPTMRLDRDHLVGARIDDGHIFEVVVLALAGIAGVILEQSDARERVLQQLPLEDLWPARAEHLELYPERGIFIVARDIAVGGRLLDHPTLLGRTERLTGFLRHLLLEPLQRFAAFGLERVLLESGAIIGYALVGAIERLVDIASDAQGERIVGCDLERRIRIVQRLVVGLGLKLGLGTHGVGPYVVGIDLERFVEIGDGIVEAPVLREDEDRK